MRPAHITATALVVLIITVLTIIFGELVPKRIGQMYPGDGGARAWRRPMQMAVGWPRGRSSCCCRGRPRRILRLLGMRGNAEREVTEEEIAASLEEGLDAGVIEAQEHQMVRNVFRLDDRQIGSMMIPRAEIVWLDANAPIAERAQGRRRGGACALPGVPRRARRRHRRHHRAGPAQAAGRRPHAGARPRSCSRRCSCPRRCPAWSCWIISARTCAQLVFVVDEYGAVQGVITLRDVLEAITGEFGPESGDDAWAVRREDGSWLMDGLIPVPEIKDRLEIKDLPEEDRGRYNTLAGMIMLLLGRLPRTTDTVEWGDWRFEVVDLDGKRVDKVLVSRNTSPGEQP